MNFSKAAGLSAAREGGGKSGTLSAGGGEGFGNYMKLLSMGQGMGGGQGGGQQQASDPYFGLSEKPSEDGGMISGAMQGAQMGSAAGPWGALIGAVAGLGLGAITGHQKRAAFNRSVERAAKMTALAHDLGISPDRDVGPAPSSFNAALQGLAGGAQQGQGVSSWIQQQNMQQQQMKALQDQQEMNRKLAQQQYEMNQKYMENPTLYSSWATRRG